MPKSLMQEYFINQADLVEFSRRLLCAAKVVAPVDSHLEEITADSAARIELSGFRAVEPFKSYFFQLIEKVSSYFGKDEPEHGVSLVLFGARGCDLEALEVLDRVYLEGDFKDPYYASNREKVLIIGADCTDCGKTCFCTMVKGKPYPTKMFDLNLSSIEKGFMVEIGSEKGEKLVADNKDLFRGATEAQRLEKIGRRRRMEQRLEENNRDYKLKSGLSEIHKANLEDKVWRKLTKDCVECSACNLICPSCSCFLLIDADRSRYKVWDACLKAGYARVAGGANSRPKLYERLQNRYHCKFDYSFDRLGRYTCVGCGRCIDACAGNIDMRVIFKELERQAPLTAKLE